MLVKILMRLAQKFEWHHAYYALALIDIFTILAALYLTQALMTSYEESVAANRRMSTSVSEFIKLSYIVQNVNEPGNRVFESKDVAAEQLALKQNLIWYDTALNHARQNLTQGFKPEQVHVIENHLNKLTINMENMVEQTSAIFMAISANDIREAGSHMAIMDGYYYQVSQAIGDISQYISDLQLQHLQQQIVKAKKIKQYEIYISIIVLLIIVFVTFYGHKLGQKLKQNAEQLKLALVAAEQSTLAKERFLANMSHEIRTPMNGVLGLLKLIDKSSLSDEDQKHLQLASKSADSLLVIINDILDLSKIEQSQLILEQASFNLVELIEQQASIYQLTAQKSKQVQLICDLSQVEHKQVVGDSHRLQQVLNNLLNNAIKFTAQGEITITARTKLAADNVNVVIEVKDTGIGIPNEQLAIIFEQFMQADTSTTRKYGGTGLGLAISKKICQLMDGNLTVTSELDKGSCFTVDIILAQAPIPQTVIADQHQEQDVNLGLNMHLLVAEDNRVNQVLIKKLLDRLACTYDIANNGSEAIALLNHQHDAILMDCSMPVLDGYEATKAIRGLHDQLADIYIIAVTANSMPEDQEKCLQAGMNDYITKPIIYTQLAQALKTAKKKDDKNG